MPKAAPTRKKRSQKPGSVAKRKRHGGRQTVWTPDLENAIVETLETMGCSFEDAAIFHGISYETLKARQRSDAAYSARLARARTNLKVKTLGKLHELAQAGSVHAGTWWLERTYPDEYGRRVELSGGLEGLGGAGPVSNVTNNVTAVILSDPKAREGHDAILAAIERGTRPQLAGGTAVRGNAQQPDAVDSVQVPPSGQPVSTRGRRRPD